MTLNTVENICGNGFCQASETFSTCAVDCKPGIGEFVNCVVDKGGCNLSNYTDGVAMFIFFLALIGLFVYLRRQKII